MSTIGQLRNYIIKIDAQDLLAELSDIQFNWRPGANRWSIAESQRRQAVFWRPKVNSISLGLARA
jgi:hypothetical protein